MGRKNVYIRVDGNLKIGMGHIMRCIALGQGFRIEGFEVTFITIAYDKETIGRIEYEGFPVKILNQRCSFDLRLDLRETLNLLPVDTEFSLVVTDGYKFDQFYQQGIKEKGYPLMCIDDIANTHFYADVVLNQNINANSVYYSKEPYTVLLLGTKYALIREEFLKYRRFERHFPEKAKNILLSLGGGDPENHTLKILQALELLNDKSLNVNVLVGLANPNIETLRKFVKNSKMKFTILSNTPKMPELLKEADLSISAAGTTTWELCLLGLPGIVGILAENQVGIANGLEEYGAFNSIGWFRDAPSEKVAKAIKWLVENKTLRSQMSRKGKQLVDGLGVERVVNEIDKRI